MPWLAGCQPRLGCRADRRAWKDNGVLLVCPRPVLLRLSAESLTSLCSRRSLPHDIQLCPCPPWAENVLQGNPPAAPAGRLMEEW